MVATPVLSILPYSAALAKAEDLEVFNVLNLLNRTWGLVQAPKTALLGQVRQTTGTPQNSPPIFRFDPNFQP